MIPSVYFSLFQIHHRLSKLIILILLLASISSHAQTIRYVLPIPMGNRDGSSWANATNDLQSAINSLTATGGQVWVASGRYKPTTLTGPDSRTISFQLKSGVAIYGGFTGNEANLSDRVESRPASTTLSGNIGDESRSDDNSYNVLTSFKVDPAAALDGLVVAEGNANGPISLGGGIFLEASSLRLNNCYFVNNKGRALYSENAYNGIRYTAGYISNYRVTNCVFQDNEGGAIGITNGMYASTNFVMINCVVQNNAVLDNSFSYGGAIYTTQACNLKMINCTFRNNYAVRGGLVGTYLGPFTNVDMLNCVAFGNQDLQNHDNFYGVSSLTIRYSLIDQALSYLDSTDVVTTTSPFVSETSDQLTACAPAVDAGDPTTAAATVGAVDLVGNPRYVRRIDMGAYEYQGALCVLANGYMYSLQAGRWDDPTTWSEGRIPTNTDKVLLKHAVTIPQSYQAHIQVLRFDPYARLIYETGGRLLMNQ